MSRFWLAAKIALYFALVLGSVLLFILFLFMHVVGHELVDELGTLRAHQGLAIAYEVEPMLASEPPDSDAFRQSVAAAARRRGARVEMVAAAGDWPSNDTTARHQRRPWSWRAPFAIHTRDVDVEGRVCRMLGPPSFATLVPLLHGGEVVAALEVRESLHTPELHLAFMHGLRRIGLVALVFAIALAVYLTLPLRRMSRSMNRIAAGELDHRVAVRGRGEVAAMGRSFNQMADRIGEMVTGQKELMAGVSHELRSPLARIKLCVEMMRQGRDGTEKPGTEKLDDLEADVDVLDGLVGELLLISRLDLGSVPLERESVTLNDAATAAWQRISAPAAALGMSLVRDIPPGAESVHADRSLLIRVLGNLFENAVRHAATGDIVLRSHRRPDDRIEITVTDSGPGVGTDHLPRLFEPFYRADPSRSRRTGAGGLGLMIVRRAVEAHGGTVQAHHASNARATGGGLAIRFDLPAAS